MVYGDGHVFRQHEPEAPSVFGPEHLAPVGDDEQLPETVYVPSQRVDDLNESVTVELRRLTNGNTAMLAFTTLQHLVDGCGNRQPWIAVKRDRVDEVRQHSGADVVLWDAALPMEDRRSGVEEED